MNGANYTVWHRRWALVEALAAAEAETKASYVSPAIDEDDGEDHREHPAPSLVDPSSRTRRRWRWRTPRTTRSGTTCVW